MNDDFDVEAMSFYFGKQLVKEAYWHETVKQSFLNCRKEMEPHYVEIQKRANFTKEQCDVKYNVMISCIDLQLFHVS